MKRPHRLGTVYYLEITYFQMVRFLNHLVGQTRYSIIIKVKATGVASCAFDNLFISCSFANVVTYIIRKYCIFCGIIQLNYMVCVYCHYIRFINTCIETNYLRPLSPFTKRIDLNLFFFINAVAIMHSNFFSNTLFIKILKF